MSDPGTACRACGRARPLYEETASDIDLLLVIESYDELGSVLEGLASQSLFSEHEMHDAAERIDAFAYIRSETEHCIFSHKFTSWPVPDEVLAPVGNSSQYTLSLHAFSLDDFRYLILADLPQLDTTDGQSQSRELRDYRNTAPNREDNQRCFAGLDMKVERVHEAVERGYVGNTHVFDIHEDRFYPGLYQNLVLPQFDIRWESQSMPIRLDLLGFRWKIVERLREERRQRAHEFQRLSLSHTRSAVFAPHVTRRVDRD